MGVNGHRKKVERGFVRNKVFFQKIEPLRIYFTYLERLFIARTKLRESSREISTD